LRAFCPVPAWNFYVKVFRNLLGACAAFIVAALSTGVVHAGSVTSFVFKNEDPFRVACVADTSAFEISQITIERDASAARVGIGAIFSSCSPSQGMAAHSMTGIVPNGGCVLGTFESSSTGNYRPLGHDGGDHSPQRPSAPPGGGGAGTTTTGQYLGSKGQVGALAAWWTFLIVEPSERSTSYRIPAMSASADMGIFRPPRA
jgi:hypothetical protein